MQKGQMVEQAFNDSVGVILGYLDEAETGAATKRAVKAELWDLCDRKIKPLVQEQVEVNDDNRFNR